jgi:heme/copper-type cytochrome/quinol oxidase subunit 2
LTGIPFIRFIFIPVQAYFSWMILRWLLANISSDGQPLSLGFAGSPWVYIGWQVLMFVSIITIIGWAWVYTAQMRWMCRHIEGTRRDVVFEATGLQYLWRAIVTLLACSFIIPIPWALRWFMRWHASQTVLVERTA